MACATSRRAGSPGPAAGSLAPVRLPGSLGRSSASYTLLPCVNCTGTVRADVGATGLGPTDTAERPTPKGRVGVEP